jgi:hypothetical protein
MSSKPLFLSFFDTFCMCSESRNKSDIKEINEYENNSHVIASTLFFKWAQDELNNTEYCTEGIYGIYINIEKIEGIQQKSIMLITTLDPRKINPISSSIPSLVSKDYNIDLIALYLIKLLRSNNMIRSKTLAELKYINKNNWLKCML